MKRIFANTIFVIVIGCFGCAKKISYINYLKYDKRNKVIVDMSEIIKPTFKTLNIDSLNLMKNIIDKIIVDGRKIKVVVYYNGASSWEYDVASVQAFKIRNFLIEQGFSDDRISYEAKFYNPNELIGRFSYKKICFMIY